MIFSVGKEPDRKMRQKGRWIFLLTFYSRTPTPVPSITSPRFVLGLVLDSHGSQCTSAVPFGRGDVPPDRRIRVCIERMVILEARLIRLK